MRPRGFAYDLAVNPHGPSAGFAWGDAIGMFYGIVAPYLPWFALVLGLVAVFRLPLPRRGPGMFTRRDPWRGFRFQARQSVLTRAGNRCEEPLFLAWVRCRASAREIDHVYPWSKGGATVVSNGQALCTRHNRTKSSRAPAWWYVLSLEHRRREYYPPGVSPIVRGTMTPAERAAREAWAARKSLR